MTAIDEVIVRFENGDFTRLIRLLEAITDPDLEFNETHVMDAEQLLNQLVDMETEAKIDWDAYSIGEMPLDEAPTGTYRISPDEILYDPISKHEHHWIGGNDGLWCTDCGDEA